MKKILTVMGTRPECLKLMPVVKALQGHRAFNSKICLTRQQTSLLDSLHWDGEIKRDYLLDPGNPHASLAQRASHMLVQLDELFIHEKPDLLLVQGDTTTAFVAALGAFYNQIQVAHVEAGLRTGNLYAPWPEEAHRVLIDRISHYFFAPTPRAKDNLQREGVHSDRIWVVGNTAIDALRLVRESFPPKVTPTSNHIVVTIHRRENHGEVLLGICAALKTLAFQHPEVNIIFCLHPHPSVCNPVLNALSGIHNIALVPPMDHVTFVQLLDDCLFVVTDSGGLQEEVSFLGKPVLITRNTTEREEVIDAGTGILVGVEPGNILKYCSLLLKDAALRSQMSKVHFPYGHGYAAQSIVKILEQEWSQPTK